MSFPGGHVDATDASPQAAAVRETAEELGVDLVEADYIGALDQLQTPPAPDLIVHPFVYLVGAKPDLVLDKREVQHTHWLSLAGLLNGSERDSFLFEYREHRVQLPCVNVGEERLWGLSLRIVDDLLNRLDGRGVGLKRLA